MSAGLGVVVNGELSVLKFCYKTANTMYLIILS